jgi:hypothetical protein
MYKYKKSSFTRLIISDYEKYMQINTMYFLLRNIGFERVALALVDMKKSPCEKNDDNFHFEWRGEKKSKILF